MNEMEMLDHFKKWCISLSNAEADGILGDEDWKSLSIGYFLGQGADIETAFDLALEVAYAYNYWKDE